MNALCVIFPYRLEGVWAFDDEATARFVWTRAECEGHWYRWPELQMEGWLCPALLKYFESPPKEIFVQASAKSP